MGFLYASDIPGFRVKSWQVANANESRHKEKRKACALWLKNQKRCRLTAQKTVTALFQPNTQENIVVPATPNLENLDTLCAPGYNGVSNLHAPHQGAVREHSRDTEFSSHWIETNLSPPFSLPFTPCVP